MRFILKVSFDPVAIPTKSEPSPNLSQRERRKQLPVLIPTKV